MINDIDMTLPTNEFPVLMVQVINQTNGGKADAILDVFGVLAQLYRGVHLDVVVIGVAGLLPVTTDAGDMGEELFRLYALKNGVKEFRRE